MQTQEKNIKTGDGSSLTWRRVKEFSLDINLSLAEDEPEPVPLVVFGQLPIPRSDVLASLC